MSHTSAALKRARFGISTVDMSAIGAARPGHEKYSAIAAGNRQAAKRPTRSAAAAIAAINAPATLRSAPALVCARNGPSENAAVAKKSATVNPMAAAHP